MCPEREHAPHTPEGYAALDIATRAGIWRRAGMDGQACGLDWAAVESAISLRAAAGINSELLEKALVSYESGMLAGMAQTKNNQSPE